MDIERYKQRLLELERKLGFRLGHELANARETRDDQPGHGNRAMVDETRASTSSSPKPTPRSSIRCGPRSAGSSWASMASAWSTDARSTSSGSMRCHGPHTAASTNRGSRRLEGSAPRRSSDRCRSAPVKPVSVARARLSLERSRSALPDRCVHLGDIRWQSGGHLLPLGDIRWQSGGHLLPPGRPRRRLAAERRARDESR
jgi:hypothetical protein